MKRILARGVHIECPVCRGSLGVEQWKRITRCSYCDTPLLVEVPGAMPRYYVPPKVDKDAARRSLQRALLHPDIPQGFLSASSLKSCDLCFVPFHELFGRRIGTIVQRRDPGAPQTSLEDPAKAGFVGALSSKSTGMGPAVDTRVILGDVNLFAPAVELPTWGLSQVSLSKARTDWQATILPYDTRTVAALGTALVPRLDPQRLVPDLGAERKTVGDNTTVHGVRLRVVFFPVWRLRYLHLGRLYSASVDGVTGQCLYVRAPQGIASRTHWLMASALAVGLVAGSALRIFWALFGGSGSDLLAGLALALLGLGTWALLPAAIVGIALLLVAELGYEQFRYPGEVVIENGLSRIEKLGALRPLFSEKISAALEKWLSHKENQA